MYIYQSKKKVNEQFEWKMNGDVNGNRKLFRKEVSNPKRGKVKSCSRVQDGNGNLTRGEDEVRRIWKEYFEGLYSTNIQKQVPVHMCGFDGIRRGNYFFGRAEVEVRVGKLKNGKIADKGETMGEMIKGRGGRIVDWIWGLCNIAIESGVVLED